MKQSILPYIPPTLHPRHKNSQTAGLDAETRRSKHALQAEDRAHRLGQQGCVQVRYLIAPGTIDDAMWPLLGRKLQVVGKALDGHATGSATGIPYLTYTASLSTAVQIVLMVVPLLCCDPDGYAMGFATSSLHDHATGSVVIMMIAMYMFASRH